MNKNRIKVKKIMGNIRQVLLNDWDPIGIKDVPEAQDEYDSYMGVIYTMIESHTPAKEVAEYLIKIETEEMGLGFSNVEDLLPIVKRLLSIDTSGHK